VDVVVSRLDDRIVFDCYQGQVACQQGSRAQDWNRHIALCARRIEGLDPANGRGARVARVRVQIAYIAIAKTYPAE